MFVTTVFPRFSEGLGFFWVLGLGRYWTLSVLVDKDGLHLYCP